MRRISGSATSVEDRALRRKTAAGEFFERGADSRVTSGVVTLSVLIYPANESRKWDSKTQRSDHLSWLACAVPGWLEGLMHRVATNASI